MPHACGSSANIPDTDLLSGMAIAPMLGQNKPVSVRSLIECCTEYCSPTSTVSHNTKWADTHLGGGDYGYVPVHMIFYHCISLFTTTAGVAKSNKLNYLK